MGPITLENVRASSDITINARLKDGGIYIAWTSLSEIKAYIFSDDQKAIAGRCAVSIDSEDSTVLVCEYSALKPQYPGVNSLVIRAVYDGRIKTYDVKAINIVPRTANVSGDIVLDDPTVDLELEVTDVSSSLLDLAIRLAFKAADEVDQALITHRGPAGKSAYEVAVDNGFVGSEQEWLASLVGPEGPHGQRGQTGPAGVTSATVSVGPNTGTPSASISVVNGLLSLILDGLKGNTGEQGPVGPEGPTGPVGPQGVKGDKGDKGNQGDKGEKGDRGAQGQIGPAGVTSAVVQVNNTSGTPSATANVSNGVLTIVIDGIKGEQGNSGYTGAAGELQVVNDRTTGGAENAWSAEQGKELNQEVPHIAANVGTDIVTFKDHEEAPIYPYVPERAMWDADGYTAEQKFSEVKPSDLYGPVNYDVEEIDVTGLTTFTNTVGLSTFLNGGTRAQLLVNEGDVVKITGGSVGCRFHFLSHLTRGLATSNVPSVFTAWIDAAKTYYFHVPTGARAMAFSMTQTNDTDCSPSALSIASPKITGDTVAVNPCPVYQFRINDANDKLVAAETADAKAYVIRIKAGERYNFYPVHNGSLKYGYIAGLPKVSMAISDVGNFSAAQFRKTGISFVATASSDCYCFIVNFKTGEASMTMTVERVYHEDNPPTVTTLDAVSKITDTLLRDSDGYEQIDLSQYEKRNYNASQDTSLYGTDTSVKHVIVPVTPGEIIKVVPNSTYYARIAWLNSDAAPVASGLPAYVPGTRVFYVRDRKGQALTVPENAIYMYVYIGTGRHTPSYVGRYTGVSSGEGGGVPGDILALNPDSEFDSKLISANKRYGTSSDNPEPLVIAHLSDIHGNWDNVRRFIQFCDHHGTRIQVRLNTGDTVESCLYNGSGASGGIGTYQNIDGVGDILTVIGNHDTALNDGGTWSWREYAGKVAYDDVIAPHVASWGVIQPDDAAENGYCYYYKDFAAKNIRLVVTDVMGYDNTQDSWLAQVLAEAKAAGYHVVIATHFAGGRPSGEGSDPAFNMVECNYTTLYSSLGSTASGLYTFAPDSYKMMDTVDAFQQGGGIFIGYIQGHYHVDFVARCGKYPNQLIFSIGATKAGEMRDYNHVVGKRDQDEFQIVSIDTYDRIVKLYKVGANVDRWGRHKNAVCVSYDTRAVVTEAY